MSSNVEQESFGEFFEKWMKEQNQYLRELISTTRDSNNDDHNNNNNTVVVETLMNRVIEHYEHYYEVKSYWVEKDALGMIEMPYIYIHLCVIYEFCRKVLEGYTIYKNPLTLELLALYLQT